MLYGEDDMAGWAADHPTDHEPGTHWEYLSAVSNILAQVVRAQFPTDEEYWTYPQTALFDPIGVTTATLETDADGTWVGSSYLWASVGDWARLGQLMLQDGTWKGQQVLPPGWRELAATPSMPDGEGHGYGAQTWIPADPVGGECKGTPGLPADTLSMEGHWGQIVAVVPSRDAVVVRLGWTFDDAQFDGCQFVSDVLSALPR
jgi:CubicO group peptidase (beta-lactamase class C family)